jgi:molecular chaperone GrpE
MDDEETRDETSGDAEAVIESSPGIDSQPESQPTAMDEMQGDSIASPEPERASEPLDLRLEGTLVSEEGRGPEPGWLDAVSRLEDRLGRRLDSIQSILERESRAEANRERVVDRLHAELQEYKQDLLLKVQRPIFIDLIQLHDDIGKMIEARPGVEVDDDRNLAVRGILDSIRVAIEDILYRQGVEPFTADGESFDPRRQRAVATVATDDPAINKAIAARLRKGFQVGEKVIRPELVSVYTTRPSATAGPPP